MNKQKTLMFIYVLVITILIPCAVYPCTTFVLRQGNRLVFGRNLDWYSGTGLVMVNPRNLEKVALVNPSDKPVKWVSKFGSITFNQRNLKSVQIKSASFGIVPLRRCAVILSMYKTHI